METKWAWRLLGLYCAVALVFLAIGGRTSAETEGIRLPIVMYHSLLKDERQACDYIVTPATFEADVRALLSRGYTTIQTAELIAYVERGEPLPDKPVMLTFDDGHLNTLTYALPILEKLDAKAVVSVVGAYADEAEQRHDPNPQYAYMDWAELAELRDSGRFEILSHSYGMHQNGNRKGVLRKRGEALAAYREVLTGDTERMQTLLTERLGLTPQTYTYPYGFVDGDAEQFLRQMGFKATLSCFEHVNRITRDPRCLFSLGRFNRGAGISTEAFVRRLETSAAK